VRCMQKNLKSKYPLVTLIVLNWNGEEIIKGCLESLLKTKYPNFKTVVVDNASKDKSVEIIRKYFKGKVDLIVNKENLGFSKGMNVGIRYVLRKYKPSYVGLLNNDLLFPDKFWLLKIVKVMENDKSIGVASPMFIFPDGRVQRVGEKLGNNIVSIIIRVLTALPEKEYKKKPKGIKEVDIFLGAAPIFRAEMLKKLGLLDERYSPFLCEEVEYSYRLKKHGYKSVTVCDSEVIHLLSYSMKKMTKEEKKKDLFKVYIATRNAFLFSLDYFGLVRSLIFSLPVIIFATFFGREEKHKGLTFRNLKLRSNPTSRFFLLIKAIYEAFKLKREKPQIK